MKSGYRSVTVTVGLKIKIFVEYLGSYQCLSNALDYSNHEHV